MIKLNVDSQKITITNPDEQFIVSTSQGIYDCEFSFSADWATFAKTAVFAPAIGTAIEVVLTGATCTLPHEVITSDQPFRIGVYGTKTGKRMPTVWSERIRVRAGAGTGTPHVDPTPDVYQQILTALAGKADGMSYANNVLSLLSGQTVLATVTIQAGGTVTLEMRVSSGYLQYKVNSGEWTNVIAISSIVAGYATEAWVEAKGYLTEHQSLSGYATQTWVQQQGYQTAAAVSALIATALTGYATQSWVEAKGYLTEHQSLSAYRTASAQDVIDATKAASSDLSAHTNNSDVHVTAQQKTTWNNKSDFSGAYADLTGKPTIPSKTSDLTNDSGFLTEHQSLAAYRTSAAQDIIDAAKYEKPASGIPKTDLASAVQTSLGKADTALQEHQSLTGYATQTWVNQQGFLTEHQSLTGYATETWVNQQGFLTAHQDISGKQDKSNLVTAVSSASTDAQYPSAKLLYDTVGNIESALDAIRGVSP